MNKLSMAKRAQIIGMLVEGNSMRAVSPQPFPEFFVVQKPLPSGVVPPASGYVTTCRAPKADVNGPKGYKIDPKKDPAAESCRVLGTGPSGPFQKTDPSIIRMNGWGNQPVSSYIGTIKWQRRREP